MANGFDILLVEDNADLADTIIAYLEAHDHRVHYAADGEAGLRDALYRDFDVVLLDLSLPCRDGLDLCAELRRRAFRRVPVMMLTARDTLDDKLAGFAHGADDYLVKPFSLAELLARIGALGQRRQLNQPYLLAIGPLRIDRQARTATRDGETLHLSPVLWDIMLTLAERAPNPVSRNDLTLQIWGEEPPPSDALRAHMHLLRQVVDRPFAMPLIETVHGVGFRLKVPE
ncbi:response regulator transcription factor [Porphyrobacter sp. CACIAM 03H1]|uniref:response regulator transcription factor n=1 Tax=Porphyrobacter sp. CACIAM 03H1 TaxID=2003315 RepID=UPI000B5A7C3F|nr:response regulator transcription factor [Porphyrobacter sp. CACIAM 03H1]ASJ91942.1 DNA-binding response regulator [Porphyrobacter sp. CACIAM 03H1]